MDLEGLNKELEEFPTLTEEELKIDEPNTKEESLDLNELLSNMDSLEEEKVQEKQEIDLNELLNSSEEKEQKKNRHL